MTQATPPRRPRAFALDDPDVEVIEEPAAAPPPPRAGMPPPAPGPGPDAAPAAPPVAGPGWLSRADLDRGFRWGSLLAAAAGALASLALALWFVRFTSIAFTRNDWLGWLAFGLLVVAAVALLGLIARELIGLLRFRRLGRTRRDAEEALRLGDRKAEAAVVRRIVAPFQGRPELKWSLARLDEHARAVGDPGDLLRLADRDVLLVLDGDARRVVAAAARRVGVVSAISPTAALTVGWVLIENLRLMRALAGVYGGRPGFVGTLKLARMVLVHIVATGGMALTDDLVGQFLGQDLVRRLSRRLGESIFNAALTARVGAAAIAVTRPLPFIEAPPIRARDFIAEITRRRGSRPWNANRPGAHAGAEPVRTVRTAGP